MPRALGWSLLAVVFLGPMVWPWYETWGLVVLALAADTWSRRVVLVASSVACFATVPAHLHATTGRRRGGGGGPARGGGRRRLSLVRSAS